MTQEIQFTIDRIKEITAVINREFYKDYMTRTYDEDYEEEYPGYTEEWLKWRIEDLYYLILAFLEQKSALSSYESFKGRFEAQVLSGNVLTNIQYHPEGLEAELKIVNDFYKFLYPYPVFDLQEKDMFDISKVHSVISNTEHIIKKLNVTIVGEADIYTAVRWVLGLYFPKVAALNKASFIKTFKTYHPDILIPELKTAVEYKFVRLKDTLAEIENRIDDIYSDSINYQGDPNYTNFIAAVHLEDASIVTPERIEACWFSKNFPKNWKLIVT